MLFWDKINVIFSRVVCEIHTVHTLHTVHTVHRVLMQYVVCAIYVTMKSKVTSEICVFVCRTHNT